MLAKRPVDQLTEITGTRQPPELSMLAQQKIADITQPTGISSCVPDPHSVRLMAGHARTFNFAARFLPVEKRDAAIALYAFFRTLDDLVDEPASDLGVHAIQREFAEWRRWLNLLHVGAGPREPLASQLVTVVERYKIPISYFLDLLDGLESDLFGTDYENEDQLHAYCYKVASTVGLAMSHVLGARSSAALSAASDLGLAMQLTNILRDVGEDLSFGRVYLPKNTLLAHQLSRDDLTTLWRAGHGPDERLRALMAAEIARVRTLYTRGIAGIWLLPADSRLPILIASRLYRRILAIIEANDYDSLRVRASTTKFEKVEEAVTAMLLNRLWRRGEYAPDHDYGGLSRKLEAIDAVVQR